MNIQVESDMGSGFMIFDGVMPYALGGMRNS